MCAVLYLSQLSSVHSLPCRLCVLKWGVALSFKHHVSPTLAKGVDGYGWTMCDVHLMMRGWRIVITDHGESTTANTMRMLVLSVKVNRTGIHVNLISGVLELPHCKN